MRLTSPTYYLLVYVNETRVKRQHKCRFSQSDKLDWIFSGRRGKCDFRVTETVAASSWRGAVKYCAGVSNPGECAAVRLYFNVGTSGRADEWCGLLPSYIRPSPNTAVCAFALPYVCAGSTFLDAMGLTVTRWPPNARPFRPWRANRVVVAYIVIHLHHVHCEKCCPCEDRSDDVQSCWTKIADNCLRCVALWSSSFPNRPKASVHIHTPSISIYI